MATRPMTKGSKAHVLMRDPMRAAGAAATLANTAEAHMAAAHLHQHNNVMMPGSYAFTVWLMRAADAIFPKQQAQTALPPVSPVPGRTKRHKQGLKHTLLTAAPACTLEIPKQKSEEEVWNALRCGPS